MKRTKEDWVRMGTESHRNSKGLCEWCGDRIPLGTYPAHIIPRAAGKISSDEAWNIASLCVMGNGCHSKFDKNRARALEQMEQEGAPLAGRIWADPRLRDYFTRKLARLHYIEGTKDRIGCEKEA